MAEDQQRPPGEGEARATVDHPSGCLCDDCRNRRLAELRARLEVRGAGKAPEDPPWWV